jgi:Do/DeqQ family serine protease
MGGVSRPFCIYGLLVTSPASVYFKAMIKLFLTCAVLFMPAAAYAQSEDIVPQSPAQITLSFAPIVKKVSPAVVNIYTQRKVVQAANPFAGDPFFSQFFGHQFGLGVPRQRLENSLGSGVIVRASGLVVTNAHVVKGADEIKIILADGREFDARVALMDEASDIALLRFDAKGEELPYASFQPSETLEVGDLVIAIGNPFGVGQTVTSGIVSALARSSMNINNFNFFIQTDAAINPGNSGGPLVSMNGGVVGINSAIYSKDGGSLGIGFAVPSEMVATIIAAEESGQVTERGGIKRPWVGIDVQDVTADIADSLGLPLPSGALVTRLHSASPARDAGLQQGDVVTAVNGKTVKGGAELRFRLAMIPLGEKAKLDFWRKGDRKSGEMKAILPPDKPARDVTVLKGDHPFSEITVMNLNPAVAVEFGLDNDEGVIISEMKRGAQISQAVRPGDIILKINDNNIKTVSDLTSALKQKTRIWQVVLMQNGRKRTLMIR